jgi:DNA-binding LacI/PurR family transcriptional regulator
MSDVARAAGVSAATVSRALRGEPGVSEATRAHVAEVARRMRYAIARDASSLAGGRRYTVAVVATGVGQGAVGAALAGAEGALRAAGYDVLLYAVGEGAHRERFFEDLPLRRRVDGVLGLDLRAPESAALAGLGVPVLVVGESDTDDLALHPDPADAVRVAADHLVSLGHRDIALLLAESTASWSAAADDLDESYRAALTAAGLSHRPEWTVWCSPTVEGGEDAVAALLDGPVQPTALITSGGQAALGAFLRLRRDGWAVPGQISLVCLDGGHVAESVGLTSVDGAVHALGERAARALLSRIDGATPTPDAAAEPTVTLVRRASSGPLGDIAR